MPTSVNNREYRWPGGLVPYKIDSTFLRDHKSNTQQLEAAKAEYASKTCIKLEELPPGRQSYHVNLISDSGCYSYIGRLSGISGFSQSQDISIGIGCNFKSTIVHEFLHALGFWHEQSRPDRDDYVTILWQNIRRGVENNFQKHGSEKTTNLGVEYDYESVMHYGRTAFSVNGQPTIVRKDDPEGALGQRTYGGLSAKDAEEINIFYNCKTPGTTAPPPATPSTTPPTTPSTSPPTTPSTSPPTTPSISPPPTIEIESGVRVFIKSVGCYDPGVTNCDTTEAVIKVNDAVMSCPNPKGACLTILDGVTGEIEETINEMSTDLVDYLPILSSKPKKLILGTVKGTWSTPRDRRSLRILRRYLYRLRVLGRRVYFRNASFAFIGWSGPGRVSVTRGVYTNARRGPSVISRKIYFPLA
ncbi:zinc metalloproteinase nas-15-like [Dendronephthya gigantea]|uniref:zinc metalloproteinase nas-15-like n=1 Tax=Dendronephthya gigantea TaxID=151771 RepID=UPI00106AFC2D|nr:zinc metalloproteinase nas-15-like [Dendronephthya gigantea]